MVFLPHVIVTSLSPLFSPVDQMQNSEPEEDENQSNLRSFLEETIQGINEAELNTRIDFLNPEQLEGPEVSLRPSNEKPQESSVDASSIGQRQIQSKDPDHPVPERNQQIDYRVLELLGEGGMGQVHLAEQVALGRNVAVKQIRSSQSSDLVQREFLKEASVTGKLEHPNIVPIYEVGQTHQGNLFYSMKNIQGSSWSTVIDECSLLENLEILLNVSDAVAFAHSQGVIHRDLKPDNIMIGGFGEVLVLDWGLAVILDQSTSVSTSVSGTPAYMPPEMVNTPEQVSRMSDIYLLGAILYRILAGHPPHGGASAQKCLLAASRNEILPCSRERLAQLDTSGELLEIALRAMKARPDERFQSVKDFQESLRQFLQHRDSLELMSRADLALKAAHETGDYSQFSRALFGYEEAVKLWDENLESQNRIEQARIEWAHCAESQGDYDLCLSLLDEGESNQREFKDQVLKAKVERESRQARLQRFKVLSLAASLIVAVLASGAAIWIKSERDKAVAAEKMETQERLRADKAAQLAKQEALRADQEAKAAKQSAREARQNQLVAERNAYGADMLQIQAAWEQANLPRVNELLERYQSRDDLKGFEWNYFKRLTEASLETIKIPRMISQAVSFSPDGRLIAVGYGDGRAVFYDPATTKVVSELKSHTGDVTSVCFSSDGKYYASSGEDGRAVIHAWPSKAVLHELQAHQGSVLRIRFSPDSTQLASAGEDKLIKLWDVTQGSEIKVLKGHTAEVADVDFSPDGTQLISGGYESAVRLWDLEGGKQVRSLNGFLGPVNAVAFHPQGKYVAAGGRDNRVLVWDPISGKKRSPSFQTVTEVYCVEFSPDGKFIAYSGIDDRVYVADFETGEIQNDLRGHVYGILRLSFSPDGRRLASASPDRLLKIWDLQASPERLSLAGHKGMIRSLKVSPDGSRVATGGNDGVILIRDADSGQILEILKAHEHAVLSLDIQNGGYLVSGGYDKTVRIWNSQSGKLIHTLTGHQESVTGVSLTADGKHVLSTDMGGDVRLWDLESGTQLRSYDIDPEYGSQLVVVPERNQFITCHKKAILRLRDLQTGELIRELDGKNRADPKSLSISEDGTLLAAGMGSTVKVWNLENGERLHSLEGHNLFIYSLTFNSDASRLASSSLDGTIKIWNLKTGQETLAFPFPTSYAGIDFHPDGQRIYASGEGGELLIWDARLWTESLRNELQARYLLNALRKECLSLEDLQSAIAADKTVSNQARQQAQQWAKLFWQGHLYDLVLNPEVIIASGNFEKMLQLADLSRKSGSQTAQEFFDLALLYSACLTPCPADRRDVVRRKAIECFVAGCDRASFEEIQQVLSNSGYSPLRYERAVLHARQLAMLRLWNENPNDLKRIRNLALCHFDSGILFLRQGKIEKAIENFLEAQKLHRQCVAVASQEFSSYDGVKVSSDRLGQSYLEAGLPDEAVRAFAEAIQACDQMLEREMQQDYARASREILIRLKTKAEQNRLAIGDWKDVLLKAEKTPLLLYYRAVNLALRGNYDDAMQAAEKLRTLNPQSTSNSFNAACAYARCAELLQSSTGEKGKSTVSVKAEQCIQLAIECLQNSRFAQKLELRNDPDLQVLHRRDEFQKLIGLQTSVDTVADRTVWKTSQAWIDNPDYVNHSTFEKQPDGTWQETGIDFNGNKFTSQFTLHETTPLYLELNKEGTSIRVRLWPDKAFWGAISAETDRVSNWGFLQEGSWARGEPSINSGSEAADGQ